MIPKDFNLVVSTRHTSTPKASELKTTKCRIQTKMKKNFSIRMLSPTWGTVVVNELVWAEPGIMSSRG
jgi:hypothetical protein